MMRLFLQSMFVLLLFCLFCSIVSAKYNVGFVFAGSARTFAEHFVHESIRLNLIHAYCPPKFCKSAIFARISLSDNIHQTSTGTGVRDGTGKAISGNSNLKPYIEFGFSRLAKIPEERRSVPLVLSWADIGTDKEHLDISSEFTSFRHRFFHQYDARRYSMYYNRHKSYQQLLEYETQHRMKFDWVVHARLDFFWGEPILPITYWMTLDKNINHNYGVFQKQIPFSMQANNTFQETNVFKVWTPDSWWSEVADTFALIPRHFADGFFDLDSLVAEGVMCLGGPNIDQKVASEANMKIHGYTADEISQVPPMLCSSDEYGFSEQILKRKLQYHGIDLGKETLGYATVFATFLRTTMQDGCMFTEKERLIGWLNDRQYANGAVVIGCLFMKDTMMQQRSAIMNSARASFTYTIPASLPFVNQPVSRMNMISYESNCVLDKDTLEYTGTRCVLDKHVTDWNFMPFRIHSPVGCMNAVSRALKWEVCKNKIKLPKHLNYTYDSSQLFQFFPKLGVPQPISIYPGGSVECWMANEGAVVLGPCNSGSTHLFLVKIRENKDQLRIINQYKEQYIVHHKAVVSHQLLPATMTVSIAKVMKGMDRGILKAWYDASEDAPYTAPINSTLRCVSIAGTQGIRMMRCDPKDSNQRLIIERSTSNAWIKYIRKRLEYAHYYPKSPV